MEASGVPKGATPSMPDGAPQPEAPATETPKVTPEAVREDVQPIEAIFLTEVQEIKRILNRIGTLQLATLMLAGMIFAYVVAKGGPVNIAKEVATNGS